MRTPNLSKVLIAAAAGLLFTGMGFADTLELKDGRVLQGRYLSGTQAVLRFEVNGNLQTFNVTEVVALTFTRDSGASAPPPAAAPATVALAPTSKAAPTGAATIPAGQAILVRMIDAVDSSKNHVGDIFHAS